MVPRCGYYVDDGKVKRVIVKIDWNLGFDKVSKQAYVKDLHEKIIQTIPGKWPLEVTTAAEPPGKWLSPIYIKFSSGKSMEDIWREYTQLYDEYLVYDNFIWKKPLNWKAFTHYYCVYADVRLATIRKFDIFTDVFYNPEKTGGTQALDCACLKLMDMQNNLKVRETLKSFCDWCEEYIEV